MFCAWHLFISTPAISAAHLTASAWGWWGLPRSPSCTGLHHRSHSSWSPESFRVYLSEIVLISYSWLDLIKHTFLTKSNEECISIFIVAVQLHVGVGFPFSTMPIHRSISCFERAPPRNTECRVVLQRCCIMLIESKLTQNWKKKLKWEKFVFWA